MIFNINWFILFHMFLYIKSEALYTGVYSAMKVIDEFIYIGGMNYLSKYHVSNNTWILDEEKYYTGDFNNTMNGSDIGFNPYHLRWPTKMSMIPPSPVTLAFDNCLNWKDSHKDASVRQTSYDNHRINHHTESGQWPAMDFICSNNFIKAIHEYNGSLWICGTFGAFPRSFLVNKTDLSFIRIVDTNVMSCARYVDEPMATYMDKDQLYVASGWGLYKPSTKKPDIPNNNSTMMYADWRLYRNLFPLPSTMAWVLSSDVNFINVVEDDGKHLYFFGHEINNQYGLNNQEDRHAWQSFMLRVCKKDLGFKYVPDKLADTLQFLVAEKYFHTMIDHLSVVMNLLPTEQSYNSTWYQDQVHLPTTHFVSPLKINFGCYVGRRPRAISDNHFWGDSNVIYLNRLADVIFNPSKRINFISPKNELHFGCSQIQHSQIPLIGLFNRPGIRDTAVPPSGALCQLQINENIFEEVGAQKPVYHTYNAIGALNAFDEIMSLSSTSVSNFYSRSLHRTSGHSLHPFWNQGVLIGNRDRVSDPIKFDHVGSCNQPPKMNIEKFLKLMNLSNTAWPNELTNRLTSISTAVCQYSAAELYGFNATFLMPGVEFKKIFMIKDNITDYVMHTIKDKTRNTTLEKDKYKHTSPLMIVGIISTEGDFYRVVLCDFDNAMINRGLNQSDRSWYNWCIFRHTNQPYLYRQYAPMENRTRGQAVAFRASSLLWHDNWANSASSSQSHLVKEVIRIKDKNDVYVLTANNKFIRSLDVKCSLYAHCITCASDPFCMWNIKDSRCYEYQNYRESEHVQDVLDRGFKCNTDIKTTKITNTNKNTNGLVTLHCDNSGFWRGPIVWRINGKNIDAGSSSAFVTNQNGSMLTFAYKDSINDSITCIGIWDDKDTLFDGFDYEHINKRHDRILNNFDVLPDISDSSKTIIIILIIIIIILVILFVIFVPWKCKRCNNEKIRLWMNPLGHSEECMSATNEDGMLATPML